MSTPGTPTWLRTHNDRAAFRLFLEHGALTRSRLGELSGLSKPTAGQMISRLEKLGLIDIVGESSGSRGPNAIVYGARDDSVTGVAVSMLDDAIEAVVVDPTDAEHPAASIATASLAERSPGGDVRAAVAAACEAAGRDPRTVSAVTIGVQAAVDAHADALAFTDTLPGWPIRGARADIERETGLDVVIDNDVTLATIAERVGADAVDDSFVLLWLGEGLGAGIDVDGTVQRGAFGAAGEIGYLEVPRSAVAIDPDARDFTDLLGGPGVRSLAGVDATADLDAAIASVVATSLPALAERIRLLLAPITAVCDPAAIVLGGPTGRAGGDELARRVTAALRASATAATVTTADRLTVRPTAAGAHPVLAGARGLLLERLRDQLVARIEPDGLED